MRFPTFAFPATAPTRGSASGCTSSATVSGAKSVSASSAITMSCFAYAIPRLSALAFPPFSLRYTDTERSPANAVRTT